MSDEESHENYDEEEFSVDDIAGVGAVGVGSGNGVGGDGVDDYGTDDFDIQGPSSLLSSAATFGERILLPSNSHKQQSTSIQEQKQQSNSSTAIAARAAGVRLLDHIRAGDVAHAGSQAPSRVSASVQSDTTTQLFNIGVQAPDDLGAPRTSNNNHQQLPTIDSHTKLFLNSAATLIEAAVEETRSAGVLRIAATTALPSTALPSFAEALSAPPTPKTAAANAAAIICGGGSGGGGLSVSENSTAALADAAWLLITAGRRVICIAQSRVRAGDYAIVYGSRIEGNDSWVNDCSASQLSPSSRALTAQNIIGVWAAAKVAPPAPRARAPPPALILTSPLELACVAFSPQGDTLVAGGTAGGVAAWALSEPSWLHETLVATMGDGKYALRFISGLRSPSALALPLRPGLGIKAIAVLVDDAAAAVAEASARGDGLRQENETSGVIMMTATVATGGGIDASTRTVAPRRLAPGAGLCTLLSLSLSAASSSLSTSPSSSYSHLRSDAECVGTGASGGLDFLPLNTPALDITAATPLSPFRIVAIDQGGRAALWVALPLSPPRIGGGDVGAISLEALADTAADVGRAATGLLRLVAGHVGVAPATLLRGAAVLDAVASSDTPSPAATVVRFNPAQPALCAVGYSDGSVALFVRGACTPTVVRIGGCASIVTLVWIRARPGVLVAVSSDGFVAIWDLLSDKKGKGGGESEFGWPPILVASTPLTPNERLVCATCAGGADSATSGPSVSLLLATDTGRVIACGLHPVFVLSSSHSVKNTDIPTAIANALQELDVSA